MSAPALEWLALTPPADAFDEPALARIARYVDVSNAIARDYWGDASQDTTVDELVAALAHDDDEIARRFLVVADGRDVGRTIAAINREEGASVAFVRVGVVPRERGRGIGRAMAERIEREAAALGATSLQAWIEHRAPAAGDASMAAATGHGAIALDAGARLAASLGYALEQVDRISALELSDDARPGLEALHADALAHAGEHYEVRAWQGRSPAELAAGLAELHARMVTDAPSAGLDVDDERWDAARIERLEDEWTQAGQTILQAVALHRASGAVVAYTTLLLPAPGRPALQEDTLVHAEHRGHRLGMLVKAENLLQLRRLHPDCARVVTWNAEENRPMLRVNEALGFVPVGAEGGWQRRIAPLAAASPASMGA